MGEIKFKLGFEDYGNKTTTKKRASKAAQKFTNRKINFKALKAKIRRFLEEASR